MKKILSYVDYVAPRKVTLKGLDFVVKLVQAAIERDVDLITDNNAAMRALYQAVDPEGCALLDEETLNKRANLVRNLLRGIAGAPV